MALYIDQLGRSLELTYTPSKIISLVPSQTELLYDLGLDREIAGITKFCVHPQHWFKSKRRVGGTKNVDLKIINEIQPDLIIANKEENEKNQIDELATNYPVWISDISTIDDAMDMISALGAITNKKDEAERISIAIKNKFESLAVQVSQMKINNWATAYLIWRNPYMAAGGDTFIHAMMKYCGLKNMFINQTRYPEVNIEELSNCQLLLLSSEPFPFSKKHVDELQSILPKTNIMLVDGEMFSWYGSRLLQAPDYFAGLLNEMQQ